MIWPRYVLAIRHPARGVGIYRIYFLQHAIMGQPVVAIDNHHNFLIIAGVNDGVEILQGPHADRIANQLDAIPDLMVGEKLLNEGPRLIRRAVIDVDRAEVVVLLGADRTKILLVPLTIVVAGDDNRHLFHTRYRRAV